MSNNPEKEKLNTLFLGGDTFQYLTREGQYSWFKRHRLHRSYKKRLKKSTRIVVPNSEVAKQVEHYYYIPKEKIVVMEDFNSDEKSC